MSEAGKKVYFLEGSRLEGWIESLIRDFSVFSPAEKGEDSRGNAEYVYGKISSPSGFEYNAYRAREPLKSFFTPFLEKAADYFGGGATEPGEPVLLLGVKACDLAAHRVQDYVFLEGVEEDPLYRARRDSTIMVSGDCPGFKDVCFCLAMGGRPHPDEGFDLNLSPLGEEGFLAEPGSAKGEELISKGGGIFTEASEEQLVERAGNRQKVIERMCARLEPQELPAYERLQTVVREGIDRREVWEKFALTCVECGGCNFICDTCHCFLLSDKKSDGGGRKMRMWDSCQYRNFATVAGGANPMKDRPERLRNRFLKKFDFFVENMGAPACCGCGRCIEVCPGKIDIREVLKELAG